jgi:hypothetical protein
MISAIMSLGRAPYARAQAGEKTAKSRGNLGHRRIVVA